MRPLKDFSEYIHEGIVKTQSPDKSRSESLKKESIQAEVFLDSIIKKIGINNENANNLIKISYDIIMEKIRAEMIRKGYNSSGYGAHEAEVSYFKLLNFSDKDVQFCDQLRYFRNGIIYYGKSFDKDYAQKVIAFLNKIKKRLSGDTLANA